MIENIFENGGQFCMRGDPEHKPVEWHLFKTNTTLTPVHYYANGHMESCRTDGSWSVDGLPSRKDLIPIPAPPQIVPWESPDDVPDGIWIRCKHTESMCFAVTGYGKGEILVGGAWVKFSSLREMYEYHTDRRATDGWQPCGKVVK